MIETNSHQFRWTGSSFVVLAISGLAISVLIARFGDASALGIFSQASAIFFIGGLISSFGIQASVLQKTSSRPGDPQFAGSVTLSAWVISLLLGILSASICIAISLPFATLMNAPALAPALIYMAPSLFFFGQNKILIAHLNGLSRIRSMSIMQMVRALFLAIGVIVVLAADLPAQWLAATFSFSEAALFTALMAICHRDLTSGRFAQARRLIRNHLSFGLRSSLGDAAHLINLRIDILVIGYYMDDAQVGYYTIASQVIVGMIQLLNALGFPITPVMGRMAGANRYKLLAWWTRRTVKRLYRITLPLTVIAALGYPLLPYFIISDPEFIVSYPSFLILLAGWAFMSGYRPLINLLSQLERPGRYTILRIAAMATNLALNLILVPFLGLEGAAIATSASFILTILGFRFLAHRILAYPI